ncbi:uncharacterized protein TNCV_4847091 [Trichonephila clavipes]|nr:uncharacterized protein TNCV_4847091 [Trichonephila clavipes]
MRAGSALMAMMALYCSEGSYRNACNQTVCDIDTRTCTLSHSLGNNFLYDNKSTLVVISSTLTANLYVSLAIQPIALPFMISIQGRVFQQDNSHPHIAVVSQRALQSVNMLP